MFFACLFVRSCVAVVVDAVFLFLHSSFSSLYVFYFAEVVVVVVAVTFSADNELDEKKNISCDSRVSLLNALTPWMSNLSKRMLKPCESFLIPLLVSYVRTTSILCPIPLFCWKCSSSIHSTFILSCERISCSDMSNM